MRSVPSGIASPGTIFVIREHVHGNARLGGGDREPVVGGRRDDLRDREALLVQRVEDRRAEIARSDERNLHRGWIISRRTAIERAGCAPTIALCRFMPRTPLTRRPTIRTLAFAPRARERDVRRGARVRSLDLVGARARPSALRRPSARRRRPGGHRGRAAAAWRRGRTSRRTHCPLLIAGTALLYLYPDSSRIVLPAVYLGPGILVWLFARDSIHIGASGLVYGIVAYVFVGGILRRDRRAWAASILVAFFYGAMVWGVLPIKHGVSWETHLAAAAIGVVARDRLAPPRHPAAQGLQLGGRRRERRRGARAKRSLRPPILREPLVDRRHYGVDRIEMHAALGRDALHERVDALDVRCAVGQRARGRRRPGESALPPPRISRTAPGRPAPRPSCGTARSPSRRLRAIARDRCALPRGSSAPRPSARSGSCP